MCLDVCLKGRLIKSRVTVTCRVTCNIPVSFTEAVNSDKSREWLKAMDEEMHSLKENNTFTLTNLPEGKKAEGGRWVYAIKTNVDGSEKYKARYVAKGYSQKMGIDYEETFSPTANMTSVKSFDAESSTGKFDFTPNGCEDSQFKCTHSL